MTLSPKYIVVPAALCCVLFVAGPVFAQDQARIRDLFTKSTRDGAPARLLSAAAAARADELTAPPQRRRAGPGPVATGALIGAAGALVGTALAARSYGENETGGFCGRCMMQWSSFTVPMGVGIGAAIGYGVSRARRSVTAVPVFSRKTAGVVLAARF